MKQLFLLICSVYAFYSAAQVANVNRIEIDLKDGFYGEQVHEFGESGFILSAVSDDRATRERNWKFDSYSTDLQLVKTTLIPIEFEFSTDETFRNEEALFFLLRGKKGAFKILEFDARSQEYNLTEFELDRKMRITEMKVFNDYAYFLTRQRNVSSILSVNLSSGAQRYYPIEIDGFSPKKVKIDGMQIIEESNEIFVYVEAITGKKTSTTYFVRMNDKGEMKDIVDFTQIGEEIITNTTASYLSENKYVLTGTYSTKSRTSSEGMYFSIFEDGQIKSISFHNFLDLENFLNYLPERKKEKIEKKKKRKSDKGKDFNLRYYLAPHDIIQLEDGYVFLAEAYYPTYRTETYTTTSFVNGVATTTTHTRTVFDGYQYTHAFMAKFNLNGEMEWDETFRMMPVIKPFYVKRFINVAEQSNDALKLVFASGSIIHSKSVSFDGVVTNERSSSEIETGKEDDNVKYSFSNLSYWYDDYFIAYGSQKIKNKEERGEDGKKKRTVYFINKVKF